MSNVRYLLRLDDACPTMHQERWVRIESILDYYSISPMVGIIPHNEDSQQKIFPVDYSFWDKVRKWRSKGWTIALHGYNHCYDSSGGLSGLNPMWERSELAGLSLEEQRQKIRKGVEILRQNGINPKYFFAPSHTFDENTVEALFQESDIRVISDTIGRKPYRKGAFVYIPQVVGHCTELPISGTWTFCLHPNVMTDADFIATEEFIRKHRKEFIGFDDINLKEVGPKTIFDKILSWLFFFQRKVRGLR